MTGVVEGNGAQLDNREAAATTRADEVRFLFMASGVLCWANDLALAQQGLGRSVDEGKEGSSHE